jgi:hypothetical protein
MRGRWAFSAMLIVATGSSAALAQGAPQAGCRPPAQTTRTFLVGPPVDSGYQVLAQVELLDLVDARAPRGPTAGDTPASKVRVRVLAAFKGVAKNDTFVVNTGGGGCDEVVGLDRLGQKAFIAGKFVTDRSDRTYFVGQHGATAR